ncbi:Oidioi.mRNA.OKI2018_I69.chr2.g6785.t1.cds [Oikopleura dioica]|uniref:Aurora kinase n=1 Tax=Oikopleura dioica TaxID=34765 RepID=A0ABN7T4S4_OIKDI|nr:Oidioi.mRNA.OKI2018_I69.chr2.g6785.t1.cds [Oikopleura dioica]
MSVSENSKPLENSVKNEDGDNKENKPTGGAATKSWKIGDFSMGKALGKGRFGHVYCAKETKSGYVVALKVMFKNQIKEANLQHQVRREVEIQSHIKHKNICRLYGYFHDDRRVYIILEYCKNGNLFTKLKEEKKFESVEAARYVREIAEGLDYIHKLNVIHRDLKPENVLLGRNNEVKLADFGWCVFTPQSRRQTFCGTMDYLSPEMLNGVSHDKKIDHWALGCIAFELLTGYPPFVGDKRNPTVETTRQLIISGTIDFDSATEVSKEAREVVDGLVQLEPADRIELVELLKMRWLAN